MYLFGGMAMPIGVLLYWLATNIWTMAQQYVIIRNYPTPGTPAYIEWEERMKEQGKDPREIERARQNRGRKHPRASNKTAQAKTDENGRTVVSRQSTQRTTVRRDDSDRQTVVRRQPSRQTRATRKKK